MTNHRYRFGADHPSCMTDFQRLQVQIGRLRESRLHPDGHNPPHLAFNPKTGEGITFYRKDQRHGK